MNASAQLLLTRQIHASARCLDERDYEAYLACFCEDAEYAISTRAPELREKMVWMRASRTELAERLASIDQHEWEIAAIEQSRLLSVDAVDIHGDKARTSSGFALYHTDEAGRSSLYAVGRYEDEWLESGQGWCLAYREVVLKTRQLEPLSPLPI